MNKIIKHNLLSTDGDFDFVLFGITCLQSTYEVVSKINEHLQIDLCLQSILPYNLKGGKLFNFCLFDYYDEHFNLHYNFIPNASNSEDAFNSSPSTDLFTEQNIEESVRLIKELPKTDYFLIIKGEELHLSQFKILEKLKQEESFIQLQTIEIDDLPSKRNLVF